MATSEPTQGGSQGHAPGARDPQRPPGLALVILAFAALLVLGYVLFPGFRGTEPPPVAGAAGSSAMTDAK